MSKLDELSEYNNTITKDIEKYLWEFIRIKDKSNNFNTIDYIFNMVAAMNFHKTAIIELSRSDDCYSVPVLYRVMIEKIINILYISIKFSKTQSDSEVKKIIELMNIKEYFSMVNAEKKESKILRNEFNIDIKENININYPQYKDIGYKKLIELTNEYTFTRKIHYINENEDPQNAPSCILRSIFTDYSILSSFVHGGDYSNKLTIQNHTIIDRDNEYIKTIKNTIFLDIIAKINLFILSNPYYDNALKAIKILKNANEMMPE